MESVVSIDVSLENPVLVTSILLALRTPSEDGERMADDAPAYDQQFRELLHLLAEGDRSALWHIVPLVHTRLRRMARRHLARERPGHSLDSIALVHETFLNLVSQDRLLLKDRAHFLALSAKVMRQILVDHARLRNAQKRGKGTAFIPFDDADIPAPSADETLLALDAALQRLAAVDARAVRIVEQRYFCGATEEETGLALGISPATVRRRWAFAKAWLYRELREIERT
jgi:RNA polymerase sigma-70 factor, ECF subfamily